MQLHTVIHEHRDEILRLAREYGAHNVRIFGSTARGESGMTSDVDILVDMESNRSLFDVGALQIDLQGLLGCRVDVVTEKGLHWYIRDRVLQDAVPV